MDEEWQKAIDLWSKTRQSDATRRAYLFAVKNLMEFSGKEPKDIFKTDVISWTNFLRDSGLSESTIQLRISAVSSFYIFAYEECDLEKINPCFIKSIRRKINPYGKAQWLSSEDVSKLLKSIDVSTKLGARDYALLLGYILLGRRNSELRKMKWGDIFKQGDVYKYRWSGKGKKDQLSDLPLPVYNAIIRYSEIANKIIDTSWYIFPGRNIDTPLSAEAVRDIVKKRLRLAGLRQVKVHSLRHTSAMLRKEVGESLEDIMKHLGHSNLSITQIYLHSLEGNQDNKWKDVCTVLKI